MLAQSFILIGLKAGGSQLTLDQFQSPSTLLTLGFTATEPLFAFLVNLSGFTAVVANLPTILLVTVAAVIIWLSFLAMALHVLMALIEFHLVAVASTLLIPFGVNRYTAFLAERSCGAVFSGAVRLLITATVTSISFPIMQTLAPPAEPTLNQVLSVLAAALIFATLSWSIPSIAAGMILGGPALSAGSLITTTAAHGAAGVTTVRLATRLSAGALRGASSLVHRLRTSTAASGSAGNSPTRGASA
jgi:type IV secretion system protein TrbL